MAAVASYENAVYESGNHSWLFCGMNSLFDWEISPFNHRAIYLITNKSQNDFDVGAFKQ